MCFVNLPSDLNSYNLLVSSDISFWEGNSGLFPRDRFLEKTTDNRYNRAKSSEYDKYLEKLKNYPCLFLYEKQFVQRENLDFMGYLGKIISFKLNDDEIFIEFEKEKKLLLSEIESIEVPAQMTNYGRHELNRTYWAVKNVNIIEVLSNNLNIIDTEEEDFVSKKVNEISNKLAGELNPCYNIILRGAPGTGKTYLAKQVAAHIISNGEFDEFDKLSPEQQSQFEFVQFHPSYDYTDFVEGLRPVMADGQVGFEPKNGIFKDFCIKAKEFTEEGNRMKFNKIWDIYTNPFKTNVSNALDGTGTFVYSLDEKDNIMMSTLNERKICSTKEGAFDSWKQKVVNGNTNEFITFLERAHSLPLYRKEKKFVFVIDEINRGEISKIFGELFFSIDPEYRGKSGEVTTQYANLFNNEKFYIPSNVYIIGTMNDIDRSVDIFDFAMRRRFSFEEITAKDSKVMLEKDEIKKLMDKLNECVVSEEIGLSEDYQIGASYFKYLDQGVVDTKRLWNEKLKPLFSDYFRGDRGANDKLEIIKENFLGEQ